MTAAVDMTHAVSLDGLDQLAAAAVARRDDITPPPPVSGSIASVLPSRVSGSYPPLLQTASVASRLSSINEEDSQQAAMRRAGVIETLEIDTTPYADDSTLFELQPARHASADAIVDRDALVRLRHRKSGQFVHLRNSFWDEPVRPSSPPAAGATIVASRRLRKVWPSLLHSCICVVQL